MVRRHRQLSRATEAAPDTFPIQMIVHVSLSASFLCEYTLFTEWSIYIEIVHVHVKIDVKLSVILYFLIFAVARHMRNSAISVRKEHTMCKM